MASGKRRDDEEFKDYRERLKKEEKDLRERLRGIPIWFGAVQGTFRKGATR